MAAYYRATVAQFVAADPTTIVGHLQTKYAADGYLSQYSTQTRAWIELVSLLQDHLLAVIETVEESASWTVLLEFPLYRLRKRIDIVILAGASVVVVEAKCGEREFRVADERQAEEYALDLRDFHPESRKRLIVPVLWATAAPIQLDYFNPGRAPVAPVVRVGRVGLAALLGHVAAVSGPALVAETWDHGAYRPVPSVVEAATTIFSGHDVRGIALADASNLAEASKRVVDLIASARRESRRIVVFVTGVPGSGKTLAGLNAVHEAVATGAEQEGDIVYLSGNTPLVTVLREALARDQHSRSRGPGRKPLGAIRRQVRTRIQHINDFLKQYVTASNETPHEHAVVFDEAQRAWDEDQGFKKFSRNASEPSLLLEIMSRHVDWCALVCLIGGGQEINSGERGIAGWGDALRLLGERATQWMVFAAPDVLDGGPSTGGALLGTVPPNVRVESEPQLQLDVPLRSFRSPALSAWVGFVLDGNAPGANRTAGELGEYPIVLTRSLQEARAWLRNAARGQRRYGLLASSGARRLRADGVGEILNATDRDQIAHWYLNEPGDIRASFALEVPANEYTCQGLELDFSCVCWGGNLVRSSDNNNWVHRRLNGPKWQTVSDAVRKSYLRNAYRVLLTRAREGVVIWVPLGEGSDATREPELLDATVEFLLWCGVQRVGDG